MSSQVSKEEWFRSIIAQYEQRLIRYSTRLTGNREGAREVVQEAFLRLWQHEDDSLENVEAWLFRVCRNRAIDTLRRHKKITTVARLDGCICFLLTNPCRLNPVQLVLFVQGSHYGGGATLCFYYTNSVRSSVWIVSRVFESKRRNISHTLLITVSLDDYSTLTKSE